MATAGLYRRSLPCPPAIEFASPLGKSLFREALECGTMEAFFKLISYYQTQSEPAYCGLASLSMVLNALSIDPGRTWKGPWRWFDDTMLDCCEPLSKIKNEGITFEKVACLAICNGANVRASRTNTDTIDDFRNIVISCASSEDCHVIVSYHRGALKQTGTGHFSPIGGYHAERDVVLILDVARFKYPPHWVPLTCLWEGMNTVDEATGKYRGYMIISRQQNGPSVLYSMSCKNWNWSSAAKYLLDDVPVLLKSEDVRDVHEVLSVVYKAAPVYLKDLITWVAEVRRQEDRTDTLSEEEKGRLTIKEDILRQVRETEIFEHVTKWLVSELACYKNNASLGDKMTLAEIAAEVCCQGAEFLSGKPGSQNGIFCRGADVKHVEADRRETQNVVSGTVIQDGSKQGVDMLVPLCQTNSNGSCGILQNCCNPMHPSTADVLTIILLVLPQHTWSKLKDPDVQEKLISLTSTDSLPPSLQDGVLHLRQQLDFLVADLTAAASAS